MLLQASYGNKTLSTRNHNRNMWLTMGPKFPFLWRLIEPFFLMAPTAWVVEKAFSSVAHLMPKSRHNLLIASNDDH